MFKLIKKNSILFFIFFFFFLFPFFVFSEEPSKDKSINNKQTVNTMKEREKRKEILIIEKQIKDGAEKIRDLEKQSEIYKKNIEMKKVQQITLNNELDILDTKISIVQNVRERTQLKIREVNLEIQSAELEVLRQEANIENQKERIAEFIRIIYQLDQQTPLEILFLHNSISDYFNQVKFIKKIEYQVQGILDELQINKQILKGDKKILENKGLELENFKKQYKEKQLDLEEQEANKHIFLEKTKNSESKFQALLLAVKEEIEQADAEITNLEKKLREEMGKKLSEEKETILNWPVIKNRITCIFHDPTYPFRKYFEHNGIDIRSLQGSPVFAAASGYVGRAKNAGMGYSYILIIHNNGFSTVYGHISKIYVKDGDYVSQGQVIGLSGGMPGTSGAGRYSTGPHLHFEVHLNGNTVDPVKYLP